jgi:hypothetical protein
MNRKQNPSTRITSTHPIINKFLLVALLLVSACSTSTPAQIEFDAGTVIALDPVDATSASAEILAIYSQHSKTQLHFRVDFLDFTATNQPRIMILLDTFPGGTRWEFGSSDMEPRWEIIINVAPETSSLELAPTSISPVVEEISAIFDPILDTVIISIPSQLAELPGSFDLQVLSFSEDQSEPADQVGPFSSDQNAPQPIPLILTFWNSFPAATPAQALRSWDGAHAGPAGERFGLRHLLEAVEAHTIPITLADLKRGESLVGLKLLDQLTQIQALESSNLISLPDVLPAIFCQQTPHSGLPLSPSTYLRWLSSSFNLAPASTIACRSESPRISISSPPGSYQTLLSFPPSSGQEPSEGQLPSNPYRTVLLPPSASLSADGGPSQALRRQLAAAIDTDSATAVIVLGVDFQTGFWGTPGEADKTFRWITAHPWIRTINMETFQRVLLAGTQSPSAAQDQPIHLPDEPLLEVGIGLLESTDSRAIQILAWDLLEGLTQCTPPQQQFQMQIEQTLLGFRLISAVVAWEQTLAIDPSDDPAKLIEEWRDLVLYYDESWLVLGSSHPGNLQAIFFWDAELGILPIVWNLNLAEQNNHARISLNVERKQAALSLDFLSHDEELILSLPIHTTSIYFNQVDQCQFSRLAGQRYQLVCGDRKLWALETDSPNLELASIFDSSLQDVKVEDPNQEFPYGHYLPIPYAELRFQPHPHVNLTFSPPS